MATWAKMRKEKQITEWAEDNLSGKQDLSNSHILEDFGNWEIPPAVYSGNLQRCEIYEQNKLHHMCAVLVTHIKDTELLELIQALLGRNKESAMLVNFNFPKVA